MFKSGKLPCVLLVSILLKGITTLQAQTEIEISGIITDNSNNPLSDAAITLVKQPNCVTYSKNDGTYLLEHSIVQISSGTINQGSSVCIKGTKLVITQQLITPLTITYHDMKGIQIFNFKKEAGGTGKYYFNLESQDINTPIIISVTHDGSTKRLKYNPIHVSKNSSLPAVTTMYRSWPKKAPAAIDTLIVDKTGYINERVPINSYITTVDVQLEVASLPVMIPEYNHAYWSDDGFVRDCNNCYAYANNRRTDTYPQPGRASGKPCSNVSCKELDFAVLSDGLDPCTGITQPIPPGKARVALCINPGDFKDYHWYREDRNKMWSHKIGKGKAQTTDNSGKPISDPEKANRGDYTEFCGYYFVDSDTIQGGGHENIRMNGKSEGKQSPNGKLKITVMLYSGREDPSFYITDETTTNTLLSMFANTETIENFPSESVEPARLGYRGILVENLISDYHLDRYVVFDDMLEHRYTRDNKRIQIFHCNNNGTIQKWLLDEALSGDSITAEEYHFIETSIKSNTGTVTDQDGNVYQTIVIGSQEWTIEHLRTTTFNDGSPIPLIEDSSDWNTCTTPAYCYYMNSTNKDSIKTYGALYNWHAVNTKKLAPAGWHVPTEDDWNVLLTYLIDNGYNYDGSKNGNKVARSLATKTHWNTKGYHYSGSIISDISQNNSSGFSAMPGGYRHNNGHFNLKNKNCDMWSSTDYNAIHAWSRNLFHGSNNLNRLDYHKGHGLAVRLVKD